MMVSTQRKYAYDYEEEKPQEKTKPRKAVEEPKAKVKVSSKSKIKLVISIIAIFSMFMVITYRYNIINEKNLEVQGLKKELKRVSAEVSLAQIELEQQLNLDSIENYAKQKLGMQKPEKNQIIYVDTRQNEYVNQSEETTSFWDKIKQMIDDIRKNIFK